jgi:hypothetical protein
MRRTESSFDMREREVRVARLMAVLESNDKVPD